MATAGSITLSGKTLVFLIARTDEGFVADTPFEVPEELTTPGVDGRRWRTLYSQFEAFNLYTVTEASTYAVAVQYRNRAMGMINKLVNITIICDGVTYNFNQAHVNAVNPVAIPGPVVASNSTGGLAHMMAQWNIVLTDFDQNPQAGE